MKIGVLGSGKGSNFEAILKAIQDGRLQANIGVVISDVADALILEKAKKAKIPAYYLAPGKYRTFLEPAVEATYIQCLKEHDVEWIVLAGFMRVLKKRFFEAFPERVINIHPSLLPAFAGLEAWRQAWDARASVSGCTVHFVDEGIDTGPIILQESVKIAECHSAEEVHQKIQEIEHRLYPEALKLLLENDFEIKNRKVLIRRRGTS